MNDNFKVIKDRSGIDCNLHIFKDGRELNIENLNENFRIIADAAGYSDHIIQCRDDYMFLSWHLNENFQKLNKQWY